MSEYGSYNKQRAQKGRHGTLIGNWYEEQALRSPADLARPRYLNTFDRVVAHQDNRDAQPKQSINTTTYQPLFSTGAELASTQAFPNQRAAMLAAVGADAGRRACAETTYQCSMGQHKPQQTQALAQTQMAATAAAASSTGAGASAGAGAGTRRIAF